MEADQQELLRVERKPPGEHATLAQLRILAERLQSALLAVVGNLTSGDESGVSFEIEEASVGSLQLGVRPISQSGAPPPGPILATFTRDLRAVQDQHFRRDMDPGLLRAYRRLVDSLAKESTTV